jgi:hypothetical protein
MAATMPFFVRGGAINAVAEYKQFAEATGDSAAHLLAELIRIHNEGNVSDIPVADRNLTKVRELNCRCVEGWAVFYTAQLIANRCQITIVHVGNLNLSSFGALESEAEKRQRHL